MSINQTIKVVDNNNRSLKDEAQVEDERRLQADPKQAPSIDQSADTETSDKGNLEPGNYEGRKHKPEIDGPQQASQETDDVYDEGRENDTNLPPAGKNVGDLNAYDLGRHDKD
ncbi:hypothetical protein [Psychrobacter phenylpyruvicus]|uniref:Uncharacterized protein n=1 Tax=Psychrobacter phenylpyruvicus TaxID=29432 RepID=A0A379LIE5_9GAMM|nr:hypothetical protein [Psychrobacter phenylpyruvicus]SUD90336.1 Uncharacterised protein [Psychrobacter phenylpyruvicus]